MIFIQSLFIISSVWLMLESMKQHMEETKNKIMSKLSDVAGGLNAATAKLQAVDAKVQALVAAVAASNPTLDAATQAAYDGLIAEVGSVATDAGVPA